MGNVHKFERWIPQFGVNRRIHLYLPDGYDGSDERYPVVYFFDGHNLFFDSDATFGNSLKLKDFLDGWYKKLIIVGIECANDDRRRFAEYCPFHVRSWTYGEFDGEGDKTLQWIVNDLKPYIDATYRTIPFRECTAIAGYSLAGLTALYGVLRYNRWFSKCATISPSIIIAMEQFKAEFARGGFSPDTRIFFSWGQAEYREPLLGDVARSTLYLEHLAQERGMCTYICAQPGGQHCEASWKYQVPELMKFLWEA